MFKEIIAKKDERKSEITANLKEFQDGQKLLAERLKELLSKGSQLRIKDLKLTLKELNAERRERTTYHQKRIEEVSGIRKETRDKLEELKK
jgi:soluble cytochrome b562